MTSPTPTPGRFVTLRGPLARSNGAGECPAIITRVWSVDDAGATVNVTAFPDAAAPRPATSVRLVVDAAAADEYAAAMTHVAAGDVTVAHWPSRV